MTGCTLGSFASFDGIDLDSGKMSSDAEEIFEIITSCLIHIKVKLTKFRFFSLISFGNELFTICLNTWSNVSSRLHTNV